MVWWRAFITKNPRWIALLSDAFPRLDEILDRFVTDNLNAIFAD
jgi:hypothetical protein